MVFVEYLTPLLFPVCLWLFCLSLWRFYINNLRDKAVDLPLPPGGVGLPFIGETMLMIYQGWKFYSDRRERYGHIYKTHIMGKPTIRIWGTENIRKVLRNEDSLHTTSWPTSCVEIIGHGGILASTKEIHVTRRSILFKALNGKELARNRSVIVEDILTKWVKSWCEQGEVITALDDTRKMAFEFSAKMLLGTCCTLDQMNVMMSSLDIMIDNFFTLPINLPGTGFHKAMNARQEVLAVIRDIIKNNDGKGSDVLSYLMSQIELGVLTQKQVEDGIIESFFTSKNGLPSLCCSTLVHLGKHPEVVTNILQELRDAQLLTSDAELTTDTLSSLPYLQKVVKEVLRLSPPFGGGFRKVTKTFELEGYQIPAGWSIIYSIRDNHESEENFPSAEEFNPERWQDSRINSSWIPFGGNGTRSCVGRSYTTGFLLQFIAVLVKYSQWEIHQRKPAFTKFPVLLPNSELPVVFYHRKHDV